MEKLKRAYILNIVILVSEVFSIGWMMSGISTGVFSAGSLAMFRYFTVDSNILLGIVSAIAALDYRRVQKGEKREASVSTLVLKLMGTAAVTLTMLVTIFFLAPTATTYNPLFLFANSNLFLHLINPVLALVAFLGFEKTDRISFCHTFTGILPMLAYSVYYLGEAFSHVQDGVIEKGYDWYGFFFAGTKSAVIVLPLLLLITYLISFGLWKANRHKVTKLGTMNSRYFEG